MPRPGTIAVAAVDVTHTTSEWRTSRKQATLRTVLATRSRANEHTPWPVLVVVVHVLERPQTSNDRRTERASLHWIGAPDPNIGSNFRCNHGRTWVTLRVVVRWNDANPDTDTIFLFYVHKYYGTYASSEGRKAKGCSTAPVSISSNERSETFSTATIIMPSQKATIEKEQILQYYARSNLKLDTEWNRRISPCRSTVVSSI